jgi:hypothetical protein
MLGHVGARRRCWQTFSREWFASERFGVEWFRLEGFDEPRRQQGELDG